MQLRHITQHETSPQPRCLLLNGTAIAKEYKLVFFLMRKKMSHCRTATLPAEMTDLPTSRNCHRPIKLPRRIAPKSVTVVFPAAVNASEWEACSAISQTKIAHLKAQTLMLSPPRASCLATHGCIMGSQRHALSPQKSSKRCSSRSAQKNVMAASALPFAPHEAAARSYLPFTPIKAKMQDKQSGRIFHRQKICNIDIIVIFSQFAPIFSSKFLCLWVAITRMFSGTSNSQTFVQSKAQPQQRCGRVPLAFRRRKKLVCFGSPTAPRPWTAWPCRGLESWETWPFWPLTVGNGNSRNRMCMCPYLYYTWLYIYITYFTHSYICTVYN